MRFNNSSRSGRRNARDQNIRLSVVMAGEERKRNGRIAHDRQDGLDGDLSKDVIGWHPARDRRRRVAPDIQRELLQAGQAPGGFLAPMDARIRLWRGGHGCSSQWLRALGRLTRWASAR